MPKKTFFNECVLIVYSFNSVINREHSEMISGATSVFPGIGLVGRVENKWTRLRGSCRSCSASVNVGYLKTPIS